MGTQTRAAVNIYAMLIHEYVGRRLSECRWAKAKVAPFSLLIVQQSKPIMDTLYIHIH